MKTTTTIAAAIAVTLLAAPASAFPSWSDFKSSFFGGGSYMFGVSVSNQLTYDRLYNGKGGKKDAQAFLRRVYSKSSAEADAINRQTVTSRRLGGHTTADGACYGNGCN